MTSPASSGPAGPYFEGQVGGYYLLAMLAGAEARGLPGCTVDRVRLQGSPEGHSLDDVIILGHDARGSAASLEIQVKRSIDFSPSDEVFAAVMAQVSSAVRDENFWNVRRELAVATAHHSRQIDSSYQDVLTWARELGDAASFHKRLKLPKVANEPMRRFVSTFREHLKSNGVAHDDEAVWALLRRFQILVFDFTAKGSVAEDLAKERAARVLQPGHEHRASDLWRELVEVSIRIAASGGDRSREQLLQEFAPSFEFAPLRRHQEAFLALDEFSRQALADIETRIAGVRLSRQTHLRELWASIDKGRYIDIRGDAGVGKSGILRYFAEQLSVEGRVIVLSPNRTFLGGWGGMRQALGFSGTCRDLLSEIAANGGGAIFVDNLDFFREDERPTVADVVREAATIPGLLVVTTARRSFGTTEKNWLPSDALDRLGRTQPITVGEIDNPDLEELRSAAPQLVQLLRDDHPAREVIRNLFRLSQLAERAEANLFPRTEAEMASEWWREAGTGPFEGRRERSRLLKLLAEHSLFSAGPADTSRAQPEAIDVLIKNETLIELNADKVVFRHDVFREWAVGCLLFNQPESIDRLPLSKPAPADLGRAVELFARMTIENATAPAEWLKLLTTLSAPGVHGSWRRAALLALVRSEVGARALDTAAPILLVNQASLLCELIRLTMAVDVEPARSRLAAAGVDETLVPASMNVPSGLSWFRLVVWVFYRVGSQLPPEAIPDVFKLYSGWCFSTLGADELTPTLVKQMYRWLREIELARDEHPYWGDPGVFSGAIKGDLLKTLEDDLRFNFAAFAFRVPTLAAEYLQTFKSRSYSEQLRMNLLQFRGSLAQAAPAELVDFTLATLIPEGRPEKRRAGALPVGPFGFTDAKFLPCSPAQGPFFDLLTHAPHHGLHLIRRLVDYSISFHAGSTDPGEDGIAIELPDGPRLFAWQRTYMWSREAYSGPYVVTSALMALEAWAHLRLDKGEPFEAVLRDVLGDPGAPAAYLLPVVDLILSHWPESQRAAVPFLGSPELLALDRSRFAADSMPELPDILGLKELEREPVGAVSREDLKKRPSRRLFLDQLLAYYAFPSDAPDLHDVLKRLLQDAAGRLQPPTEFHNLGDPEFMVVHAMNVIDPLNWQDTTVTTTDGRTVVAKEFVMPASEASQLERLNERHENQNADKAMQAAINAAVKDPSLSTEEFHKKALAFVLCTSEGDPPIEEEQTVGTVSPRVEASMKVALLLARDGSPALRKANDEWIRSTFGESFSERERDTHRYSSEYRFNPQALSFVGYVWLLKHERNAANVRLLLQAASFDNPSAATGFKAACFALAEIDERLIRAILRCALTARITPVRDWQNSKADQEQQTTHCKENLTARIEAEAQWLAGNGDEPQWPRFPDLRPRLRNGIGRGRRTGVPADRERPPEDRFYFEAHGAAEWVKALENLFDVSTRSWLRDFVANYCEWTSIANGSGLDRDERIEGEPDAWNEAYFKLAAFCLPGLSLPEVKAAVLSYFDRLPDETLFDNVRIFLRSTDEVFFNRNALSSEAMVLLRSVCGDLFRLTRGWTRLKEVRTDSAEMHISNAVSTFYFNDSGAFLPSKCYLRPAAIPRVTPLLETLAALALDCRAPLIGSVLLNLIEVSPDTEHLEYLILLSTAWVESYGNDARFWVEYQFGKRVCSLIETILKLGLPNLGEAQVLSLDRLLGRLVQLGIPEAHRAENVLRPFGKI